MPEALDRAAWRSHHGRPAMGSCVDIVVIDDSAARADEAVAAACAELERLVPLFDRHDRASAVACLNAAGRLRDAPPDLVGLVTASRRFALASDGAFDVTVAPLVDLFREHRDRGAAPPHGEVVRRRELVGCGRIALSGGGIALTRQGMALTFDGIAKGAVVDAMAGALERRGATRWLVNAGGDIRCAGANERGEPWAVGVRDPAAAELLPETLYLTRGAVATSGSHAIAAGTGDGDIVHGALGVPPRHCATVTVVAPNATAADALATAAFVLGPRAGVALIERLRCACLIVLPDGRVCRSSRWKEMAA
jgi:thiamine biosynthesis lipoprotein